MNKQKGPFTGALFFGAGTKNGQESRFGPRSGPNTVRARATDGARVQERSDTIPVIDARNPVPAWVAIRVNRLSENGPFQTGKAVIQTRSIPVQPANSCGI